MLKELWSYTSSKFRKSYAPSVSQIRVKIFGGENLNCVKVTFSSWFGHQMLLDIWMKQKMEVYYVGPEGWKDGGIDIGIEGNFIYTAKLD